MKKPPKTNDFDLRALVVDKLLASGIPREAIRHEITLDSYSSDGRADLVLALDRALWGIEIKSGRDTLDRLPSQRERYQRRFDRLCLVLDARHVPGDGSGRLFGYRLKFGPLAVVDRAEPGGLCIRETKFPEGYPWEAPPRWLDHTGPSNVMAPAAMLSMLNADEVRDIAAGLVLANKIPAAGGGQRFRLVPHLAEHASIATLRPLIAKALRERPLGKWDAAFWGQYDARPSSSCLRGENPPGEACSANPVHGSRNKPVQGDAAPAAGEGVA